MRTGSLQTASVILAAWTLFGAGPGHAFDNIATKTNNTLPAASDGSSTDGRIPFGTSGRGDDAGTRYPSVIRDGSLLRMWYAGSDGANYRIYCATSQDGYVWTKLDTTVPAASDGASSNGQIPLGTAGRGDDTYALGGSVILDDDGVYKIWYTGYDGVNDRIFYATSPDGLTWTKFDNTTNGTSNGSSTNGQIPMGASGRGDDTHVATPCVIKDGGTYRMWYSGHDGSHWRIYYATSSNGLNWVKADNTIPTVSNTGSTTGRVALGLTGSGDTNGTFAPAVVKAGNDYYMWYSGNDASGVWRSYFATSSNGLQWVKVNNTAPTNSNGATSSGRIPRGTAGKGDETNVLGLAALQAGDFRLWYSGGTGAVYRIYYAQQEYPKPIVVNVGAVNVTTTNADLIGTLTYTGGAPAEVFVYWGLTDGVTTAGSWATNSYLGTNGLATLTNSIAGLASSTLYYFRFYATNALGYAWASNSASFSTLGAPVVDNDSGATSVGQTAATLRGTVSGSPTPLVRIYYGVTPGTTDPATWSNVVEIGFTIGSFQTVVAGLLSNQTNYYRCWASNANGAVWAADATNFVTASPSLSISDATVTEGNAGTTNAVFAMTLSSTSALDVAINYATSNGLATAGTDYIAVSNTFVIASGASTTGLSVSVNGDTDDEYPSENFYVRWSGAVNATLATTLSAGTILDDDSASQTKTWSGVGLWTSITNWTPAGEPGPADDAIVPSGTVLLANATAQLGSFTMTGGSLTFTNWASSLSATDIVVSGGTVTLPPPFSNNVTSNRIYFICSNLTLGVSGTIDANGKGYMGIKSSDGAGPGAGNVGANGGGGGSYGGTGGGGWNGAGSGGTYGASSAPRDPGSAGGGCALDTGHVGGHAGGAVRIQATGLVTINGTLRANGLAGTVNGNRAGGGSGGGVYITCDAFAGSGAIQAIGGDTTAGSIGGGGGGGRIAIVFNPASQALLTAPTVRLSTIRGLSLGGFGDGTIGTFYFPDASALDPAYMPHTGQMIIPGFTSWSVPSLHITNAWLSIPTSAYFPLTVAGDMSIMGVTGRLDLARPIIECGGDLTLTNGGQLVLTAALTNNPATQTGGVVTVAGNVMIGTNSWLLPTSSTTNGASVVLRMANLTVARGGGINADGRGYRGGLNTAPFTANGYGPGKGTAAVATGSGGGYGGRGGRSSNTVARGATYGVTNAPIHPGSGGGARTGAANVTGSTGGGLIRVIASGSVALYGVLTANGTNSGTHGGGSGGGIFIECVTFAGGSNALLSAEGGDADSDDGAGGGGRIAVWYNVPGESRDTLLTNGTVDRLSVSNGYSGYWGQLSVIPGSPSFITDAETGTVIFLTVSPASGSVMWVR